MMTPETKAIAHLRDFAPKGALVTNTGSGIGRAAAVLFARRCAADLRQAGPGGSDGESPD